MIRMREPRILTRWNEQEALDPSALRSEVEPVRPGRYRQLCQFGCCNQLHSFLTDCLSGQTPDRPVSPFWCLTSTVSATSPRTTTRRGPAASQLNWELRLLSLLRDDNCAHLTHQSRARSDPRRCVSARVPSTFRESRPHAFGVLARTGSR